jgi:V8-like Glu-specific endopeptidase
MLDLLQAAAAAGRRTGDEALPPDDLRFSLEYAGIPDVAAERGRISALLGSDGFDLFAYSAEDPTILILQFTGVAREQSAEYLFAQADELVDALGLISVVPDIEAPYADILSRTAPATEGLGEIFWNLCRAKTTPPDSAGWANRLIKADRAWSRFGVSGAGVLIGQPDTGVAEHDELDQGVDRARGFDFIANRPDPTDPLLKTMASPGHGTGTSSVVISRAPLTVTGSAPGATLIPIRCVDSVVLNGGTALARAIDHARAQNCRVITMSLGGLLAPRELRRAIVRAVRDDIIVLAAAGNCVGFVTYPADDRNVIAVAGVDENRKRWKGSCHGRKVDISAPGENVWVARRDAVPQGHQPSPAERAKVARDGQGTSFAVALTAGVAALWLEHFGFAACRAEARRRGNLPVQELFRAALKASADASAPGWDSHEMGAGVIDAEALLALPLASIPLAPAFAPEAGPLIAMRGDAADAVRYSAELDFIARDRALRSNPGAASGLETPLSPVPSPRLARLITLPETAGLPSPAVIGEPLSPPKPLSDALRRLGAARGGGLESATSLSLDSAVDRIRSEGAGAILSSAETVFASRRAASPRTDAIVQQEALERIDRALAAVTGPQGAAAVADDGEHRFALEALVRLTGRPALRLTDDDADLAANPNTGQWAGLLLPNRQHWRPKANAVGRIDVTDSEGKWVHAGTGILLPDNHVMTNRHVLDVFADPIPGDPPGFHIGRRASIIFDPDAADETRRFEITGIATAGRERIGRQVDMARLDMAILALDPASGGTALPTPVTPSLSTTAEGGGVENILVIGYPARPGWSQAPADGATALTFWDRVAELYGDEFGVKYISPGVLMDRPGHVAGDPHSWAFSHDATTFAGNSGSAILALTGEMTLCGLHFGGSTLTMNLAHDLQKVRSTGAEFMNTGFL